MWYTPLIASLPPWWRLLQCLRRYRDSSELVHLANALKYTSSIVATIIGAVRKSHCEWFGPQRCRTIYSCIFDVTLLANTAITTLWILASFINSCYTSVWDIKMDWGLLRPSSQNFLLRDELVFHKAVSISHEVYHGCLLTQGVINNRPIILLRFSMCVFDLHGWPIWCVCVWMVTSSHSFWQQWRHVVVYNGTYSDWKTRYVQQTSPEFCNHPLIIMQYGCIALEQLWTIPCDQGDPIALCTQWANQNHRSTWW